MQQAINASKITRTIPLTFGATANIYGDGDVMIETRDPHPYFVLSKEDLDLIRAGCPAPKEETSVVRTSFMNFANESTKAVDSPNSEVILLALKEKGYKSDQTYVKIYGALDPEKEKTASDICMETNMGVSRTAVSDKLIRLEACGFAKKIKAGNGIASLWLRA